MRYVVWRDSFVLHPWFSVLNLALVLYDSPRETHIKFDTIERLVLKSILFLIISSVYYWLHLQPSIINFEKFKRCKTITALS